MPKKEYLDTGQFCYLELVGRGELVGKDLLLEGGDGVPGLPHLLHLVAGAVRGAGVRHRVPRVPVRLHLHQEGTWRDVKYYANLEAQETFIFWNTKLFRTH